MNKTGQILFVVFLAVLAVAGFYLGTTWRGQDKIAVMEQDYTLPPTPLVVGSDFPDAVVVDADGSYASANLIGDSGAIVMFLEIGCPPCSVMAVRWEKYLRDGRVPSSLNVFGISSMSVPHVASWRDELGLTFPIYTDSSRFYDLQFGLTDFPQRVVVDRMRVIRYHTYDAKEEPDAGLLSLQEVQ